MKVLTWTPIIFSRKGFPRDPEGKPFVPRNFFEEAITSAVIFYYIKKDKEIENKVKAYLMKSGLDIKKVSKDIKNIVLEKYPIMDELDIPEITYIDPKGLQERYIEIFDLKEWIDVDGFKTETYTGVIDVEINSPYIDKLKAAAHSYAEALARIEMSFLKEHPLVDIFYKPLLNDLKKWDIPLRLGMWTETSFKGDLLFFWRIKEVREKLLKELKIDIRPRYVLYIPKEKATTGWSELTRESN